MFLDYYSIFKKLILTNIKNILQADRERDTQRRQLEHSLNQKFFSNDRRESSSEDLSKTDESDTVQSLRELLQEVCLLNNKNKFSKQKYVT